MIFFHYTLAITGHRPSMNVFQNNMIKQLLEPVSQPVSPSSTPICFDPFLFVDSLTNRGVHLKDMRNSRNGHHVHHSEMPSSHDLAEMRKLDECIDMIKSTNKFKIDALREQLFKQREPNSQVIEKKRLIRKLLIKQIEDRSRDELKQYLNSPEKKPKEEVMNASKQKIIKINKKTVSEVIFKLRKHAGGNQALSLFKKKIHSRPTPEQKQLEQLRKDFQQDLRSKFRQEGEYLLKEKVKISPLRPLKLKKEVRDSLRQSEHESFDKENTVSQCHSWNPLYVATLNENRSKNQPKKLDISGIPSRFRNRLFQLMIDGSVQDVQVILQKNDISPMDVRDSNGNTLLHLAVLHKRGEIFDWLAEKVGVEGLLVKNRDKITASQLAKKLDHLEVVKNVPNSMM